MVFERGQVQVDSEFVNVPRVLFDFYAKMLPTFHAKLLKIQMKSVSSHVI